MALNNDIIEAITRVIETMHDVLIQQHFFRVTGRYFATYRTKLAYGIRNIVDIRLLVGANANETVFKFTECARSVMSVIYNRTNG